eukprot:CAMPEP_0178433760 /NCGR_PEP_ID=MMETSP0689_2-20121128/33075_1 /TAXON_ID=160604 /ORGANISM="Amphidinium massartii, Strain CS-259" /LENGTH=374 /DNA_ID=CAMNT_0020055805 /DNA_START=279 /DNA_END=1403 /DNA_ORIENTATION=-
MNGITADPSNNSSGSISSRLSATSQFATVLQMPEVALEVSKIAGLRPASSLCTTSKEYAQHGRMLKQALLADIDCYVDFYVCGSGTTVEQISGAVERHAWTTLAPRPTLKDEFAVTSCNGKLYVVGGMASGGCSEHVFATMEEYDPATGLWREMPPMHKARYGATAAAFGDMIYVIGGQSSACKALDTVEAFDLNTGVWRQLPSMLQGRTACAVVHLAGELCVVGGTGLQQAEDGSFSSVVLSSVEKLDCSSGSWVEVTVLPTPREACAAVALDGKLCVLGGRSSTASTLATVEAYDPSTNSWEALPSMPVPRHSFLAAVAASSVFVAGGNFGTSAPARKQEACQRWNTVTGEWKDVEAPVCHNTLQGGGLFIR